MSHPVLAASCALALTAPVAAAAQTAPAPTDAQPAKPADPKAADRTDQEVVVTAEARDRQLIDRKSYVIQDNPASQTKSATEVLRDLPSVSVNARGQIQLLGNPSVRIQIDGRETQGAANVLAALAGNQIARVEVITNPSAEFSSSGTAGIINIILRKTYRPGIGGTATGSADTLGGFGYGVSPTWSRGKWTLSASPRISVNRQRGRQLAESVVPAGTPPGISNRVEDNRSHGRNSSYSTRAQVGYKFDDRRSATAGLSTYSSRGTNDQDTDVRARAGEFAPFSRENDMLNRFNLLAGSLEYRADGITPGDSFTASTEVDRYTIDNDSRFLEIRSAGAGRLRTLGDTRGASVTAKFDYAKRRGKADRLALGGQFDASRTETGAQGRGVPLLGPPLAFSSTFGGSYAAGAGYATYQTGFGKLKVMPGLRVEGRHYRLDGPGDNGPSRLDLFPSLHVQHPLLKKLDGTLSYSRRVDWPDINQLSPIIRYFGPISAYTGNPALRPAFTDAIEAKLAHEGSRHQVTATLFDRITHDTFDSNLVLRSDGVQIGVPINAGLLKQRGAELALQGRLRPRLRYNASGNIAATNRRLLAGRDTYADYQGRLTLTYAEPRAAAAGYDLVELGLRYTGPVRSFQYRGNDRLSADVTWTHRLTPQLAAVLFVSDPFGAPRYRNVSRLPNLIQRSTGRNVGPVVRLSLTYSLAKPPPAAK